MDSIDHKSDRKKVKQCALIVAHPDDETLWAGGTVLMHPSWNWLVACLCRKSDENREPRFYQALSKLNADGVIGDLDDGPDQRPLSSEVVEQTLLKLLPKRSFDLIITHNITGEYTRHLRHEETSRAVINLWAAGSLMTKDLWLFAYTDHNGQDHPQPIKEANSYQPLPSKTWVEKHKIITETYGFDPASWEAKTTPLAEAFWQFKSSKDAKNWLVNEKRST